MIRAIFFISFMLSWSLSLVAEPLKIVGDNDFPPFSFTNAQNQVIGIDIDILNELSKRIDIEFEFELVPWKRLLLMTKAGKVFGSFSLFRTTEREEFAQYTYPVHYSTFKLFTLKNKSFEFQDIKDLYGKRIGIEAGFSINEEFDSASARGDIILVEIFDYEDSFRRVLKGGIDAFIGNELVTNYQLQTAKKKEPNLAGLVSLPKPLANTKGAFFVLSKKYPMQNKAHLARKITDTLRAMEEEGLTQAIVKRYVE